jgi:preprotein translocase subunit SecG
LWCLSVSFVFCGVCLSLLSSKETDKHLNSQKRKTNTTIIKRETNTTIDKRERQTPQ